MRGSDKVLLNLVAVTCLWGNLCWGRDRDKKVGNATVYFQYIIIFSNKVLVVILN